MPKQDKVKRMNQRRIAPTDRLGLGAAVAGGGSAPGSLDVSTSNNAADPHTHEIIADWDPRIAEALLKTNPNGWSNLVRLYLDELYAEAGQDLVIRLGDNAGARNLSIEDSDAVEVASIDSDGLLSVRGMASAGDLLPTVAATYDLGSEELPWKKLWANEFEFGEIDGDLIPTLTDTYDIGSASKLWRRGYLSELDTFLLVENAISVIGGIQVIGHGQGTLAVALGDGVDDTQIDVGEGTNLAAGDFVLLRASLAVEYLEIVSDDGDGLFTVDRDVDGSGRNTWPQGAVWVNLGQTGDGRIELAASTTPRISIALQGAAYNLTDEILRIGDLNGSFGVTSELYGLGVGDYVAGNYLRYDPTNGFLLSAGDGEVTIDENGVTLATDMQGLRFISADPLLDPSVIYEDSGIGGSGGLKLVSSTRQWEIKEWASEPDGNKLAFSEAFLKLQANYGDADYMDFAFGDASNNWAILRGKERHLSLLIGNTASPPEIGSLTNSDLGGYGGDSLSRVTNAWMPVSVDVPAGATLQQIRNGVSGATVWVSAWDKSTSPYTALGWIYGQVVKPSSGTNYYYFQTNRTYMYGTAGNYRLALRHDGYLWLDNNGGTDIRVVGWVVYW
jgi:hypothetical protein